MPTATIQREVKNFKATIQRNNNVIEVHVQRNITPVKAVIERQNGQPGMNAYELAVASGAFTGTLEEYLASLQGTSGIWVGPTPPPDPNQYPLWIQI